MMQTVQLAITDGAYAAAVHDALCHSCAWHVESVDRPDQARNCVLVLDQPALERLPLPLANPERIVLILRKDPRLLAQAWDAGIVSVVSEEDPLNTVLLAIMAAALRVAKTEAHSIGISPNSATAPASLAPRSPHSGVKRCKIQ